MYVAKKNNIIYGLLLILIIQQHCYSQDGDLDLTFNGTGMVTTGFGVGSSENGRGIAIQLDGKIIVVGSSNAGGTNSDFALARYNNDGSLDSTFNGTGLVITNFSGNSIDSAASVVLQPDGKIIAGGSSLASVNTDFALARYNSNGSLDTTFGINGLVTTNFSGGNANSISKVILQPDGKIIAVGTSNASGNNNFALARYNTNGSLDTTFGTNGLVTTDFGGAGNDQAFAAVLQPDGKIIAAGTSVDNFALARYNTNGSLDTTFGTNGLVTTNFGGTDIANGVILQPDGKIVAAGRSNASGNNDFALARYNTNGSLDTTFGTNGIVTTNFTGTSNNQGLAVVLQPNNKIVVVGSFNATAFALARYNTDGSLDMTFGVGGTVTTVFPGSVSTTGNAVALQIDGKIVAAGQVFIGNTEFALARYENCPGFDVVGSDSVLTLFTTPQTTAPNGRFAKLAMLQGGFGLCGDATFDSCFPVVGTICLACNTLVMQQDIIMDNISHFASLGNIIGNGHVLELSQSVTALPNFICTDPLTAAVTTCTGIEWGNIVVELNNNVTVQDTVITFTGNSFLIGNGNVLTLDENSALVVGSHSQLLMKNITIEGVNGTKIRCLDDQSLITLENVEWKLDGDYSFSTGFFNIARDFYITGEHYSFTYQTAVASTIDVEGRLIIGHEVTFRYAPPLSLKDLLVFTTQSSQLVLKGGILRASNVGMIVLKGIMRICRSSTLLSEGINTAQGISLGDGMSSNNNLTIIIDPAAQLVIDGPIIYNNV